MNRQIQQYLDDSWYTILTASGNFQYTEAAIGYIYMFGTNLKQELLKVGDIHSCHNAKEKFDLLMSSDFEFISGDSDCSVFYKKGRLLTQINTNIGMSYQYKGNIPNILKNSTTMKEYNGIYLDNINLNTGLKTINKYMEDNGEFCEPWDLDLFNEQVRVALIDVLDKIPEEYQKRLIKI